MAAGLQDDPGGDVGAICGLALAVDPGAPAGEQQRRHADVSGHLAPLGGRGAGDRRGALRAHSRWPEAMLRVGDSTIIERLLAAIAGARHLGRVILVGPDQVAEALGPDDEHVPDRGSIIANLYTGIAALRRPGPAAYC